MAKPLYMVVDKALSAIASAESEDSAYPKENLQDGNAAITFRGSSGTSQWVEYDFGAAVTLDLWVVGNHNLTSGMTAALTAGATPAPAGAIGSFVYRAGDMKLEFTPASNRYWRITFTDSNPDPIQIGWMPVGEAVTLPKAPSWGGRAGVEESAISHETGGGVFWNFVEFSRRTFRVPFRFHDSMYANFLALHQATGGIALPFVWAPVAGGASVYLVRKEKNFDPREEDQEGVLGGSVGPVWSYTLELTEESRGLEIAV
jgi:hypothetical protein